MIECKFHIAIIEPSLIIYEGLSTIIQKSRHHFSIYRIDSFVELQRQSISQKLKIIITNPMYLQVNRNELNIFKKNYPNINWVGLVYNYYDKEILSQFDELIQITDNIQSIHFSLDRLINSNCDCNNNIATEQLTIREKEVLVQLISGLANKDIADKLNISIHTVISHRKNITHKTGIKSQAGLTIYAISNKIISLESI